MSVSQQTYTALIADDEPRARKMLRRLIGLDKRLVLVGEAADGPTALANIEAHKPEIVFLDISMPRLSGLDVVRQMRHRPHVIFTTAHEKFAVPAFELQALDYLLKPFGPRRFETAVDRVIEQLCLEKPGCPTTDSRYASALNEEMSIDRIFVRDRDQLIPIKTDDILYLEACDDYVNVHSSIGTHLIDSRMAFLESKLTSRGFIRIHRSYIIRVEAIESIESTGDGRVSVRVAGGIEIQASRSGTKRLRARLALKPSSL